MKKKTIKSMLFGLLAIGSAASAIFLNSAAASQNGLPNPSLFSAKTEAETAEKKAPALPDLSAVQRVFDLAKRLIDRAN